MDHKMKKNSRNGNRSNTKHKKKKKQRNPNTNRVDHLREVPSRPRSAPATAEHLNQSFSPATHGYQDGVEPLDYFTYYYSQHPLDPRLIPPSELYSAPWQMEANGHPVPRYNDRGTVDGRYQEEREEQYKEGGFGYQFPQAVPNPMYYPEMELQYKFRNMAIGEEGNGPVTYPHYPPRQGGDQGEDPGVIGSPNGSRTGEELVGYPPHTYGYPIASQSLTYAPGFGPMNPLIAPVGPVGTGFLSIGQQMPYENNQPPQNKSMYTHSIAPSETGGNPAPVSKKSQTSAVPKSKKIDATTSKSHAPKTAKKSSNSKQLPKQQKPHNQWEGTLPSPYIADPRSNGGTVPVAVYNPSGYGYPQESYLIQPSYHSPRSSPTSSPRSQHSHPPASAGHAALPSMSAMPHGIRSHLLEEFRSSKNQKFELRRIFGYIVEFSQDQYGSRFIQQKLETASIEDKEKVFREILPHSLLLMQDVFGNYVIQKFFEHGTPEQVQILGNQLKGNILILSKQMYGCRVVQKALESISVEQQAQVVQELDGFVLKCVKDQNGNHVIQKCIEKIPSHLIQFIVEKFHGQVYSLAIHPYGCRVIQRILEHCPPEQTKMIVAELLRCTQSLVQDQYGNYVIQHVMLHGDDNAKHNIIQKLRGNILLLSQHKFASNVVEKCIKQGDETERELIIDEILTPSQDGTLPLHVMMKDQYANYVVQKVLDVANPTQKEELVKKIVPHIPQLKKFTYGKHIIKKCGPLLNNSRD